jgi:hypothetical protein
MDIKVTVGPKTRIVYFEHRPSRPPLVFNVTTRAESLVVDGAATVGPVGVSSAESGGTGEVILEGGDLTVIVDGVEIATEAALSLVLAGLRRRFAQPV